MDELIKRINFLYKKSQNEGLSEEEIKEQKELRNKYIKAFRQGMKNTLSNVYLVDKNGREEKLTKVKKNKGGK